MNKISRKHIWGVAGTVLIVFAALAAWSFFATFSTVSGHHYIYVDKDDTQDSIVQKLKQTARPAQLAGLRMACTLSGYGKHVRPGRYETGDGISAFTLFRKLRNGRQTPVQLTIPNVRTMDDLAGRLAKNLAADSTQFAQAFHDEKLCESFGYDTATVACLFIPNTYEVFWDITPKGLLTRMQKESRAFWTDKRRAQAQAAGLTEQEVITLASIVDQETANDAEKPMVAGMYLNRLHQGMKLQADPTVKFALRQFGLRRIMHNHLTADSPYNTYKYAGLPPGPIAIPAMSSIEAVLNFARHDYIYMCAKEDFSGTHNFATTYEEHLENAARYAKALNERNIH